MPSSADIPEDLREEWPRGKSLQSAEMQCALALGAGASRGLVCYRKAVSEGVGNGGAEDSEERGKLEAEKCEMEQNDAVRVMTYQAQASQEWSRECIAEFQALVQRELDGLLQEWCSKMGMPKPLWEISRAEAQREADAHAAPVVKNKRKTATAVSRGRKALVTRPTFRQNVAWLCHAALARRLSQSCVGMHKELAALYENIRKGMQTTLLLGKPGSGKSCVMARVARR